MNIKQSYSQQPQQPQVTDPAWRRESKVLGKHYIYRLWFVNFVVSAYGKVCRSTDVNNQSMSSVMLLRNMLTIPLDNCRHCLLLRSQMKLVSLF